MTASKPGSRYILWSLYIGFTYAAIGYLSNWVMQIHGGLSPSTYQLLDISFYYFTPMVSWLLLSWVIWRYWSSTTLNPKLIAMLLMGILLLAPIVRSFDILLDFSIKYLIGMVDSNPIIILSDVWLVVVSSSPEVVLRILIILGICKYFKSRDHIPNFLSVKKVGGEFVRLPVNEIQFIQSKANYVDIHTSAEIHRVRMTLTSLQNKLGPDHFRIHRSTIVNAKFIESIKHWRNGEYLIMMHNGKALTSSKSYVDQLEEVKNKVCGFDLSIIHPQTDTNRTSMI